MIKPSKSIFLAHVPGVENPAADYLSRLEVRPEDRVHLKLTDTISIHRIEIDIASRTPKQNENEPDYFPTSEPIRSEPIEGSETLQHPVNMQDQFFQTLDKNRKRP